MNEKPIMVARIYVTEASAIFNEIKKYLKDEAKLQGFTVFRAISGYGETGVHSAKFVDISLDLPLVIEFFDSEEKVKPAIEHLSKLVKPDHIIFWRASTNA